MQEKDLSFVIPIYRLREVGETVEQYDDHFWRNGHSVPIVVFDDSSPANQEKGRAFVGTFSSHAAHSVWSNVYGGSGVTRFKRYEHL
jgi:hypothetical protein